MRLRGFTLILLFLIIQNGVTAQYVNTDRLIVVPGIEEAVLPEYLDSLKSSMSESDYLASVGISYSRPQTIGSMLQQFILPSRGRVISKFGPRSGRMHSGTDIKMNKGDTIFAAFHGEVTRASYYYGYGNMVVIDHGKSITTGYAHLSAFLVKPGDVIYKGDAIGLAGSTGRATTSHLHLEVRHDNRAYDPELIFDFENYRIRDEAYFCNSLAELLKEQEPVEISSDKAAVHNHIVKRGESLWTIARRYRTTTQQLCNLNNLNENSVLQIGMVLKLF